MIAQGLVGDAFVTIWMITGSRTLAIARTFAVHAGFSVLPYVLPLMARQDLHKGSIAGRAITSA
jgi:hypothetical protein